MDSSIDQYSTAISFLIVPPRTRVERVFFVQLDEANLAQCSRFDEPLGLLDRGQEPVIFGDHQSHVGVSGGRNDRAGFFYGPGDGFFHQDVLFRPCRQEGMFQMKVMGSADVECFYPGIGGGILIRAESPGAAKLC